MPLFCTDAEFEASLAVRRARRQLDRVQEAIDHGACRLDRAEKIKVVIEEAIEHCRQHDAYVAVCNVSCSSLTFTLNEWEAAIDGVCWEIDRMERGDAA